MPKCGTPLSFDVVKMEQEFYGSMERDVERKIRTIVLTDCGNAHAAVHSVQPKCVDKSTRILLNYIRDYLSFLRLTFVGAGSNRADAGSKIDSDKNLWRRIIETNNFRLSFMGRKAMAELPFAKKFIRVPTQIPFF